VKCEREIVEPVELCRADGSLDPRAIGWSRVPVVRANLRGSRLRKKRWDYVCVASDEVAVGVIWADLDYLGLASITLIDLVTGETTTRGLPSPLGLGVRHAEWPNRMHARVRIPGLALAVDDEPSGTRLRFSLGARAYGDLFVALPNGQQSVNVVVPFAGGGFQLNTKHAARPVRGELVAFGRRHRFDDARRAFGCLDFGRGVWPRDTRWNWGVAQGMIGGRRVGVNLGGRWTDGTGSTENALFVDERVEKISEDLAWRYDVARAREPWRVVAESGRLDVVLEPAHAIHVKASVGVLGSELHQVWGTWRGHVDTERGERVVVDGLRGFAEDHVATW
jgi:hypothetical protein